MTSKMVFGQYCNTNSIIHKADPRIKIIITILFLVSIFLVPINNFYLLGALFLITLIIILLTKVSIFKYLKSLKQILFLSRKIQIFCFAF